MKTCLLAIESSCDDTSAAILIDGKIQSNITANQRIHEKYGGVIPEMASRKHQKNIIPVVSEALEQSAISKSDLSAIVFTRGPGLIGSLLVGVSFAKGLALSLDIPLIEVNHMQAHVLAHFIENPKPSFPFLCLTVSGGHTQIVLVKDYLQMEIVGETIDDAVGEAFDKTAKMLGLPYPGGPMVDKIASKGNPNAFSFTEPNISGLDFSFSGLKTSILYFLRDRMKEDDQFIKENLTDICASVQARIVTILMNKLKLAAAQFNISEIAIAGGVSANSGLRSAVEHAGQELGWNTYIPKFEYCTDNAAMIAMTGYYKYLDRDFADHTVVPTARYKI